MPTARPGRRKRFPNPFYVVLLLVSTLFVVTALAYLVAPAAAEAGGPTAAGPAALASWLDRNAPRLLGIECLAMIAAGLLAMATDRSFTDPAG